MAHVHVGYRVNARFHLHMRSLPSQWTTSVDDVHQLAAIVVAYSVCISPPVERNERHPAVRWEQDTPWSASSGHSYCKHLVATAGLLDFLAAS